MKKNKSPFISAVMMMGKKPEPFLSACLESIKDAVDLLVVNDNSGEAASANLETLKSSRIFSEGKVALIPSEFIGFGPCRNLCLDHLKALERDDTWVLYLDADEVHPPGLNILTRQLLPELPAGVGIVDGYNYLFFQSPRYYLSVDRRHNLFFRFNDQIRWEGAVHEKPVNLSGKRLALPYCYFHYGYLISPQALQRRWKLYGDLGDEMSGNITLDESLPFVGEAGRALPYRGKHPKAAESALDEYCQANLSSVRYFEDLVQKQIVFHKIFSQLNFRLRIDSRLPEFILKFSFRPSLLKALFKMLKECK